MGEVKHNRTGVRMELFVVHDIRFASKDGSFDLWGGVDQVWEDWVPADEALHPTQFSYELPWGEDEPQKMPAVVEHRAARCTLQVESENDCLFEVVRVRLGPVARSRCDRAAEARRGEGAAVAS